MDTTTYVLALCLFAEDPAPTDGSTSASESREDLDRALTLKDNGATVAITGGMLFGGSSLGALGTLAVGNDPVVFQAMVALAGVGSALVVAGLVVRGVGRIRQRRALRRLDDMAMRGGFVIRF